MKKIFVFVIVYSLCLVAFAEKPMTDNSVHSSSAFPRSPFNYGVGVRLGIPSGVTLKKYLDRERAWEFSLGHAPYAVSYLYSDHIVEYDNFDQYFQYEFLKKPVFISALGFQLHYLIQKDLIPNELPGLKWYYGGGAQLRTLTLKYEYRYRYASDDAWSEKVFNQKTYFALGLDGTIGLEYAFEDMPFSIFTDATFFMEVYRRSFFSRGQGGIGIRYNF